MRDNRLVACVVAVTLAAGVLGYASVVAFGGGPITKPRDLDARWACFYGEEETIAFRRVQDYSVHDGQWRIKLPSGELVYQQQVGEACYIELPI